MLPPSVKVARWVGTGDFRSAIGRTGKRNQSGNQSPQLPGCTSSVSVTPGADHASLSAWDIALAMIASGRQRVASVPPHGVCAPVPPAHGRSGILLASDAVLVAEPESIAPLHPSANSAVAQPSCFNI